MMTQKRVTAHVDPLQKRLTEEYGYVDKRCKSGFRNVPLRVDDATLDDRCVSMYAAVLEIAEAGRLVLKVRNLPTSGRVRRALKGKTRSTIPSGKYQDVEILFSLQDTAVLLMVAEALSATINDGPYRVRNWVWQCRRLSGCLHRLARVLDDFVATERERRMNSPDLFYYYEL